MARGATGTGACAMVWLPSPNGKELNLYEQLSSVIERRRRGLRGDRSHGHREPRAASPSLARRSQPPHHRQQQQQRKRQHTAGGSLGTAAATAVVWSAIVSGGAAAVAWCDVVASPATAAGSALSARMSCATGGARPAA